MGTVLKNLNLSYLEAYLKMINNNLSEIRMTLRKG